MLGTRLAELQLANARINELVMDQLETAARVNEKALKISLDGELR